eukprot:5738232-Amphidinium_carterae.1
MEPEALAPYGYEVPDSSGVRDKLDKSANLVATIVQWEQQLVRRWSLYQMEIVSAAQKRDQSTQNAKTPDREIDTTRVREVDEGEGSTQVGIAGQ